jgi:N utilization substance protein A
LTEVAEFDESLVKEIRDRARDVMLTRAIVSEEKLVETGPAEDLLAMDGMNESIAYELAAKGIITVEDLADQAVDELMEIEGMNEETAGKLIMTARIPWFEAEDEKNRRETDA